MMQHPTPEDFVMATGITTSVRDFVKMAFDCIGVEIEFSGEGINEKGIVSKCNNPLYNLKQGQKVIGINEKYFRPTEVDLLIGDATKARTLLGWAPKYTLEMLVKEMMERELKLEKRKMLFAED